MVCSEKKGNGLIKMSTKTKNRRILFVCPTGDLSSGGEKSNFELIKYLKKKKYEVFVITAWEGEYNKILNDHGIDNSVGGYKWWAPWDSAKATADKSIMGLSIVLETIKYIKPFVVVTNTLNIPWGAVASSMMNVPHVWIGREFPEGEFDYLDKKIQFINKFSNQIVANSEKLSSRINQKYKLNTKYFYSYVDEKTISLGSDNNESRIISLNGINERKNQAELIKAVGMLSERGLLSVDVLLVGEADSKYKAHLEELIEKFTLGDRVKILPFNSKPWLLAGNNDILVQTSLSESIGRTITEAMKLGVPVIASDIAGHQEAIDLGGGILYKSGDPSDLADKINLALNDTLKLKNDALVTKTKAIANMSESACNEPFVKVLESVRGKNNPMNEMGHLEPYLGCYIRASKDWLEESVKSSQELIECRAVISDLSQSVKKLEQENKQIVDSRAYKIGLFQSRAIRRIFRINTKKGM